MILNGFIIVGNWKPFQIIHSAISTEVGLPFERSWILVTLISSHSSFAVPF